MEVTEEEEEEEEEQVMPVQLQGFGCDGFQFESEWLGSWRDCFDWRRMRPSPLRERVGFRERLKMMMKMRRSMVLLSLISQSGSLCFRGKQRKQRETGVCFEFSGSGFLS